MVVEGGQQETLNLDFVLLDIHQQDVPVILRGLVLPDGFDFVSSSFTVRDVTTMLVRGGQQKTLNLDFVLLDIHQQDVPVILRGLVLPGGFDSLSSSFTVRDVTTELTGP
ncbi:unnamed protein product [Schistosoma margrebowiei]|uniref:Uncharacterized protein n=1 Tax=Schistosoma margrebowiei TaxID=48269 RepID=A0A183MVW8_9TREM|nr:unnamed protein product [Schistosoma margrebowiei]